MIDMVYSLACHLLHSTRWQDDGIVLLINSKQIYGGHCVFMIKVWGGGGGGAAEGASGVKSHLS